MKILDEDVLVAGGHDPDCDGQISRWSMASAF